ncbi:MAG: hypothetical protein U1A26_03145 [Candidatus Sungbacteria bacterium]|nr:hypothetical protein [Candidatus Sungbacteria bacterium]
MTTTKIQKVKNKQSNAQMLQSLLREVRLLRSEVTLVLPEDHFEEYEHPKRIRHSLRRALKEYPPVGV